MNYPLSHYGNAGFAYESLDMTGPETQMQRTRRLGYKLDSDKVFENDKKDSSETTPKVTAMRRNRSHLKVYIPQAERESISSSRSSRNVAA